MEPTELESVQEKNNRMKRLSQMDVWAMSFGSMVGWGVFSMPGTTFLPVAGPFGTFIALLIGMAIMLIIGRNLNYLMGRGSMTGGIYSYTKEAFGRDHAFLSSWFLCLSYLTIVFLNGTALFIVIRILLDNTFRGHIHYTVAGNDIYISEVVLSAALLIIIGVLISIIAYSRYINRNGESYGFFINKKPDNKNFRWYYYNCYCLYASGDKEWSNYRFWK